MKILVLSDIHANWLALQAVSRAEPDADRILCLGDLVNYGCWILKCCFKFGMVLEYVSRCTMLEQNRVFGKSILLVDDDQGARESIKLLLRIDRHRVTEARNSMEALALLTNEPFDLVIIDYFMPGMQGGELATKIKRSVPTLPIIMVTAWLEKLVDTDNPVDAILAKPFGIDELRQAIGKLLR